MTDKQARELWVLLHLREALGDPTGKLMHDELVERACNAWADAQRYRWLDEVALSVDMESDPDLVRVWHEPLSGYATTGRTLREAVDTAMTRHNVRANPAASGGRGLSE
ncbi:MAG: hypothetical protein ACK5WG_00955 [Betaproteobacteria bacterium]